MNRNVTLVLMWVMLFVSGFNIVRGFDYGNPEKTRVEIWNCVRPEADLLVHCKSGDDDIGAHLIQFNKSFSFDFMPKFWGITTLYFCSFRFNNEVHWFDIYRSWREFLYYDDCSWKILPIGPCRLHFDVCYHWNDSHRTQQSKNSTTSYNHAHHSK